MYSKCLNLYFSNWIKKIVMILTILEAIYHKDREMSPCFYSDQNTGTCFIIM